MEQAKRFNPEERLDRAVDAFWQNGFEGIGMQDLCKAMALFPGSVYGTYGGKRRLFLQASSGTWRPARRELSTRWAGTLPV